MIYLDVAGRCGNQMFQYAFAKKLSIINNDSITIDYKLVDDYAEMLNEPTFRDELCNFAAANCYEKITDGSNKVYQYGSKSQLFVFRIYRKAKKLLQLLGADKRLVNKLLFRVMSHYGLYWYIAPKRIKKCKQKNKFIFGYFEDPRYFDDIRESLLVDFSPLKPIIRDNVELYEQIKNTNSVCVSFRKWETTGGIDYQAHQVCDESYYRNAIQIINDTIPNALFIIFSDNIEWVKNHFALPKNVLFESGKDPVYEKFRLMSSCKHFILSNSTFAWWVQYLGEDNEKVVISPNRWLNSDKKTNPLITSNFTIVN